MFYNYFIIHYPSTIIFSFVLGMEEDKFQSEAPAAARPRVPGTGQDTALSSSTMQGNCLCALHLQNIINLLPEYKMKKNLSPDF